MKFINFKAIVAFVLVLQLTIMGVQPRAYAVTNTVKESTIHQFSQNTWAYSNLAPGPNGDLYLSHVKDNTAIAVKKWVNGNWNEITSITTGATGDVYFAGQQDTAVDGNGNIHAAFQYSNGDNISGHRGIKYGLYKNGSWTFEIVEDATDPYGWKNMSKPSIAVDSNGKAHVVYVYNDANDPRKYEIHYATNQSGSWVVKTLVSTSSAIDEVKDPQIEIDPTNTIHITYVKEDNQNTYYGNYYYIHKNVSDASFPPAEKIIDAVSDQKRYTYKPFTVDPSGKLYVSYYEGISTTGNLLFTTYFATNQSGSWQKELVYTDTANKTYPVKVSRVNSKNILLMYSESTTQVGFFTMVKDRGTWIKGATFITPLLITKTPKEITYTVDATENFTVVMEDNGLRNVTCLTSTGTDFGLPSKSTNADLSNLTLNSAAISPVFSAGVYDYTASVGYNVTSVGVTPTAADIASTIKVNGSPVVSGSSTTIPLNYGRNLIVISVTAEDGKTIKTYTVTVTRAPSSNANLAGLTISRGTLQPVFDKNTTDYTAWVSNAADSIDLTPYVEDSTASVRVLGNAVASGAAFHVPLQVGPNPLDIEVIAQDGNQKRYTVTVNRAGSSNSNLSNLTLSTGTLSPVFDKNLKNYSVNVPNGTEQISLSPAVEDSHATVTVNGSVVDSGGQSSQIALKPGKNVFTIIVTAQDGSTSTYTVDVYRNHLPTTTDTALTIDENSGNGTSAGFVSATDEDFQWLNYTLVSGDPNHVFTVNPASGEITVANESLLDYETTKSYTLTIQVGDGMDTSTVHVTINVNDLNDNTPVPQGFSKELEENTAGGTVVGTVTATDSDAGSRLTYKITDGNNNGAFAIDPASGEITVDDSSKLDYETVKTFTLTVQVSDGLHSAETTVTINLTNVNDNFPVVVAASFTVNENAADGTVIGKMNGSDADGDLLNYHIIAGNEDHAFAINPQTGEIFVLDGNKLDFESQTSYQLTVLASDHPDDLSGTQALITININDLNDNAPVPQGFTKNLDENTADGTIVGRVSATDADAGTTFTYTLTGGDGAFAIDPATGEVTVANSSKLDFEKVKSFALSVQVSDGVHTTDTNVTINLTNLNDNAPAVHDAEFSVDENAPAGSLVGVITASDADEDELTFSTTSNLFSVNASGKITVTGAIDYEANKDITFTVKVSDGSFTQDSKVTVHVHNLNDNAPVTEAKTFSVEENAPLGTEVGTITASDADGDSLSYKLNSDVFQIDASGKITSAGALDYETVKDFILSVEVSDGVHSTSIPVTINLHNLNDNPPIVKDSEFTIDDKAAVGTVVGTVEASDADGDAVEFSGSTELFAVNAASGEITVISPLESGLHTLTVKVTDGEHTSEVHVPIHVLSSNNVLSNLTISNGNLIFKPEVTDYSVSVGEKVSAITLNPVAAHPNATVKVNGNRSEQEGDTIKLATGKNTISIVVTAENGDTKTYTVTVTRLQSVVKGIPVNNGGAVSVSDNDVNLLDDQGTLVIDVKNGIDKVKLTSDQLQMLVNRQAVIKLVKEDVELRIPAVNFSPGENLVISLVKVTNLPSADLAKSAVYDFTIQQGSKVIHQFQQEIEMVFTATSHSESLKVFYWNTDKKKWELVGGTYEEGQIKASTGHFSTFAVFEPKDLEKKADLPDTSTDSFNWLFAGFIILIIGGALVLIRRYKQKEA